MPPKLFTLLISFEPLTAMSMAQLQRIIVGIPMFCIVTVVALGACSNSAEGTNQAPVAGVTAVSSAASPSPLVDPALPTAVAGQPEWEYQQEAHADFNGDGVVERAVLIANVQLADDGYPMWDDGQAWQLYIEEPDTTRTYVYARMVQLGRVTAHLTYAAPDQGPTIMIMEQTPQELRIYEVTYRGIQQVEVDELVQRRLDPANGFAGTPN